MKLYNVKCDGVKDGIVLDDMILTKDMPTTAGSRMLDGYMSLFDAEVVTRLGDAGYKICGKSSVGEFGIDLVGETAYNGVAIKDGVLVGSAAEIVASGEAMGAVAVEVNGAMARSAALAGIVALKPTYGVVSRFGIVPVVCSGECVGVMARDAKTCLDLFGTLAHHDSKDGTSHDENTCVSATVVRKPVGKVAIIKSMTEGADADTMARLEAAKAALIASGVEVTEIDCDVLAAAHGAWNILMSAELCNNVSKYDGVKYGYRTDNFTNIDELYTGSRTEAFGKLLKCAILFGSDTLSTENYMAIYDKALRVRRVVSEAFAGVFGEFDAVLTPVCSKTLYTEDDIKADEAISYKENRFVAPMMISGLPYAVAGGVALVGPLFSDAALLECAKIIGEGER